MSLPSSSPEGVANCIWLECHLIVEFIVIVQIFTICGYDEETRNWFCFYVLSCSHHVSGTMFVFMVLFFIYNLYFFFFFFKNSVLHTRNGRVPGGLGEQNVQELCAFSKQQFRYS